MAFCLWVLVSSTRRALLARRLGRFALVPGTGGGLLLILLLASFGRRYAGLVRDVQGAPFLGGLLPKGTAPWFILLVSAITGAVFGEVAVASLPRGLARLLRRPTSIAEDVIRLVLLGSLVVVGVEGARAFDRRLQPQELVGIDGATVVFSIALPGSPTDAEVIGGDRVLVTTGEGEIVLVTIGADAVSSQATIVASGLSFPQGIAVLDGVVYVTDQGELPCPDPFPICLEPTIEGELEMIEQNEGQVLAFDLLDSGELASRRVVLDGLPVVSTDHGLHDLEVGPDGRVYLSVGGVDFAAPALDRLDGIDPAVTRYLGTIVSFGPEGADSKIHARGFRNVYGLTFTDQGELLGSDNDGPSARDAKLEELLDIRPGSDFGFPNGGTLSADRDRAIAVLNSMGTAAIKWGPDVGLQMGVLIGDRDTVDFIPLSRDAEGLFSPKSGHLTLLETGGFVTTLEAFSDDLLLVGVFEGYASETSSLGVVRLGPGGP